MIPDGHRPGSDERREVAEVLKLQNMINGEFVDPVDGATEDVINPSTGEVIATAPLSSECAQLLGSSSPGREMYWSLDNHV